MYKKYNIIIFTASEKYYADIAINAIDSKDKYFFLKLYRHNCVFAKDGTILKSLDFILNLNMKKTVIIDNSPFHFIKNLQNVIPIIPFHGE